ncbi:MAG: hypothetical protein N3D20_00335 [Candidatus Pacearchaeota archaeon]|nr:hypothetical protein [Candidatus Pacearchaeota archaeon]
MDKRGQFFLMAAIIISLIIITISAVYIEKTTEKIPETAIYDLSEEIKIESNQVIDNGIFNANNKQEIDTRITQLLSNYSTLNPEADFIVVYGDINNLYLINYTATETGSVGIPGSTISTSTKKYSRTQVQIPQQDKKIKVKLSDDISFDFNITEGQNFYVILKKKVREEEIVAIK